MARFVFLWTLLSVVVGLAAGSASAFFLVSLDWVGELRDAHLWIVGFLPLAGLVIGLLYHYWGGLSYKGNNLLIETVHQPGDPIPLRMAPLVLFTTLFTHLFGGSAGREGTAVQMGGALADQLSPLLHLSPRDRSLLIVAGIAGGFAAVFGTPIAGMIFALEVSMVGRMRYEALFPAAVTALVADWVVQHFWHVGHTAYSIPHVPSISSFNVLWILLAGVLFGLAARAFTHLTPFIVNCFKVITYAPLRPVVGGVVLVGAFALIYVTLDTTRFLGLGVPSIVQAFSQNSTPYDFALKLILTAFTIGVGFKGGEVTPLFFIGATLGSALALILPLPTALLAGMGFVAVFAGAAKTPLACMVMAIELFGVSSALYTGLACAVAFWVSGRRGMYSSQVSWSTFMLLKKSA